jgi:hypothetical protein
MTSAAAPSDQHEMPYSSPYSSPLYPEFSAVMKCYDMSEDDSASAYMNGYELIRPGHDEHGFYWLIGFFPQKPWHDIEM